MRYLILVLALAGCATPEQRAANIVAHFGPMCTALGYEPRTDAWRNCIVQQQQAAAAQFNSGAAAYRATQPQPVQPRTTQCTPNAIGVSCTTQ